MNVIGFDPGKTTGVAIYHDNEPFSVAEIRWEEIFSYLNRLEVPDIYVVENYRIRAGAAAKGYQHQWSDGEALQVIGAIKCLAAWHKIPVELQEPAIKPVSAKHSGLPYDPKKKGKGWHQTDAMLHVEFYLRRTGAKKD